MDARKSLKADLEAKKAIFFEIGLVLVLALVYFSLNAKSYEQRKAVLVQQQVQNTPEEMVPITEQKVKPPPPPPPKQVTQIKIVSNDVKIDDNVDIDVNADMNTEVAQYTPPVQEEDVQEQPIFTVVEDKPSFPGGEGALMKFLATHINYPALAKESGIQGRVFISFVVEPSGKIDHVKVLRACLNGNRVVREESRLGLLSLCPLTLNSNSKSF